MIPVWLQWLMVGIFILQIILLIVMEFLMPPKDEEISKGATMIAPLDDGRFLLHEEHKNIEVVKAKIIIQDKDLIIHDKDILKELYTKLGQEVFRYADVIQEDVPHLDAKEFTAVIQVLK